MAFVTAVGGCAPPPLAAPFHPQTDAVVRPIRDFGTGLPHPPSLDPPGEACMLERVNASYLRIDLRLTPGGVPFAKVTPDMIRVWLPRRSNASFVFVSANTRTAVLNGWARSDDLPIYVTDASDDLELSTAPLTLRTYRDGRFHLSTNKDATPITRACAHLSLQRDPSSLLPDPDAWQQLPRRAVPSEERLHAPDPQCAWHAPLVARDGGEERVVGLLAEGIPVEAHPRGDWAEIATLSFVEPGRSEQGAGLWLETERIFPCAPPPTR